jgi:acid phosphatase type 7
MWPRWRTHFFRFFVSVVALSTSLLGQPPEINLKLSAPFRFVAYGDLRFTNPERHRVSNAIAGQALVQAIAEAQPAFISLGGDLVSRGDSVRDWDRWVQETAVWRERHIPVFPAIGNHDLSGDKSTALANYFAHFPELENNRYYSVRAGNTLMLVLDSSLDELSGPQGKWLRDKLEQLPRDVSFVAVVLHHPPYTTSSARIAGSGHRARSREKELAQWLEARQKLMRARLVAFAGHVHNYERHEHGGVVYFVTGGGGAPPYSVERAADDPLSDQKVNYHYLLVEVNASKMIITMNRLSMKDGKPTWTQPDKVQIEPLAASAAAAGKQ